MGIKVKTNNEEVFKDIQFKLSDLGFDIFIPNEDEPIFKDNKKNKQKRN